jgi:hypothetical protein
LLLPARKRPAEVKKFPTKKRPTKKLPAKKLPTKKLLAKKRPTKKLPAKKRPTKKLPAEKLPAKKPPGRKKPPVKPKKRESRESRVERESNTHTHGSASPKEPLADALAQDVAAGAGNMVTAPSLQQVLAYAAVHGVTPESAQNFFEYHDGNDLWRNQHGRPIPWQKKLISWARKDEAQGGPNSLKNNGKHCKSGPNRNADTFNQSLRDGHNGEPGGTSGKPAPDAGFR